MIGDVFLAASGMPNEGREFLDMKKEKKKGKKRRLSLRLSVRNSPKNGHIINILGQNRVHECWRPFRQIP